MDLLVRDTKHPKRHPFLISQEGFDRLREKFGEQYVQATEVRVDKQLGIVKVPKIEVNEKKSAVHAADKGKA